MTSVINQEPSFVFSRDEMPPSLISVINSPLQWFGTDTESRYRELPHPTLKEGDIAYHFNSKGYRTPEFGNSGAASGDGRRPITIVSIGASEVFGLGLPEQDSFPSVFANLLEKSQQRKTINWNLGLCGSSADYITRILFSALPVLKPDIVLFVLPFARRREYINDGGRMFLYPNLELDTSNLLNKAKLTLSDPENARQNIGHRKVGSEYGDQINLFKNYQICESLCQKYDVMWFFSAFKKSILEQIEHLVDKDHLIKPCIADMRDEDVRNKVDPALCWARDMGHPGVKPTADMAGMFHDRLLEHYASRLQSI